MVHCHLRRSFKLIFRASASNYCLCTTLGRKQLALDLNPSWVIMVTVCWSLGSAPSFLSGTFLPILNPLFWPWLVLRNLRSPIKVFFIPRMPAITSVTITWNDNTVAYEPFHTEAGQGTEVYISQQTFKGDFSLIAEGNLEAYYHPQYSKTLLAFSFWYHGGLKAIYSRKLIFYDRWYQSKTTP